MATVKSTLMIGVLVLASVGISPPSAQILKDPGTMTCKTWLNLRQQRSGSVLTEPIASWAQGWFVGAQSLALVALLETEDQATAVRLRAVMQASMKMENAEAIPIWLDGYCPTHAADQLHEIFIEIISTAYGSKRAPKIQ